MRPRGRVGKQEPISFVTKWISLSGGENESEEREWDPETGQFTDTQYYKFRNTNESSL